MKIPALVAACALALLQGSLSALAQAEFQFTFRGLCFQTNGAGKIIAIPTTEKTILQALAAGAGITDLTSLALVYHVQGTAFGDTIDIVNPANGTVLDTVVGFYFGEGFGRMALTNGTGTAVKRLDYIYDTSLNLHSLGAGIVNKNYVTNHDGTVTTKIQGTMKYILTPTGSNSLRVYNGTFRTGKQLAF